MTTETIINTAVPIAVFIMMFALGTGLTFNDFSRALERPKALLIGLSTQIVAVPIMGVLFVSIQTLDAEIALGIVILALCPGGAMSNVLTRIAGGDVALSVSLTAVTNLLSVATLPILTLLAASHFLGNVVDRVDIQEVTKRVVFVVTIPVVLGTLLRHFAPGVILRQEKRIFSLSLAVFILIIGWAMVESSEILFAGLFLLGWQLTFLIVLLTGLGFLAGTLFGTSSSQRTTLALETGVQNSGLGLAAAAMLSVDPASFPVSAVPAVVYSALIYTFLFPVVLWLSHRKRVSVVR
jgi:BASS family bile acid:Na+ symporter